MIDDEPHDQTLSLKLSRRGTLNTLTHSHNINVLSANQTQHSSHMKKRENKSQGTPTLNTLHDPNQSSSVPSRHPAQTSHYKYHVSKPNRIVQTHHPTYHDPFIVHLSVSSIIRNSWLYNRPVGSRIDIPIGAAVPSSSLEIICHISIQLIGRLGLATACVTTTTSTTTTSPSTGGVPTGRLADRRRFRFGLTTRPS